jgi:hypothetical protein
MENYHPSYRSLQMGVLLNPRRVLRSRAIQHEPPPFQRFSSAQQHARGAPYPTEDQGPRHAGPQGTPPTWSHQERVN